MTNGEMFKSAKERAEEFKKWCGDNWCNETIGLLNCKECQFAWLDLEANEEKPHECFYCGHPTEVIQTNNGRTSAVKCTNELCGYQSGSDNRRDTIAAHNRVAKKCSEGKE